MKIPTDKLQAAFEVCDVVPAVEPLEHSKFVRMKEDAGKLSLNITGKLWAEVKVAGTGNGSWMAFIDRRLLKAFLNAASGNSVEILKENNRIIFQAGTRVEIVSHVPIHGYESWKPPHADNISDELKHVINVGAKLLTDPPVGTEKTSAISLSKDYTIVTDTMVMVGFFGVQAPADCLIPSQLARLFRSYDKAKLATGNGVGLALPDGVIFEPPHAELKKYPQSHCFKQLEAGRKAPGCATTKVGGLLGLFKPTTDFLVDKVTRGTVEGKDKSLQLTITTPTGSKLQRSTSITAKTPLPATQVLIKRIITWLEYIASLDDDAEISIALLPDVLALRYFAGKKHYVYVATSSF